MKLAEHQDPWVLDVFESSGSVSALDEQLRRRFEAASLDECLVLAGGDHGYLREERLCRRQDSWSASFDSHRGGGTEEIPLSADQAHRITTFKTDIAAWRELPPGENGVICPAATPLSKNISMLVWWKRGEGTWVFAVDHDCMQRFYELRL